MAPGAVFHCLENSVKKEIKNEEKKTIKDKDKKKQDNSHRNWVIGVTVGTFFSTMAITYISDTLLSNANLLISFILLFIIVALGIFFDIVGIASTSVAVEPFNAMASKKIKGAKIAVKLVQNSPKVSSMCNDVIGDICGVVSGAISVGIATQLTAYYSIFKSISASLIISAGVACLTVGGKAFGKNIAVNNGVAIIYGIAKFLASIKIFFKGNE